MHKNNAGPIIVLCVVFVLCGCGKVEKSGEKQSISQEITSTEQRPGEKLAQENNAAEEEFNASGRAKAIDNDLDMWMLYEDAKTGFSFQYPTDTVLVDDSSFMLGSETPQVKVTVQNMDMIEEGPWSISAEQVKKNIEDLSGGNFGVTGDNALEYSKKVSMAGHLFAQDFMVLSRLDMCNVTVERKLTFYFNNNQIEIVDYAPINKVIGLMPEYFTTDEGNCGTDHVWDLTKHAQFYTALSEQKAPEEIQEWYDNFDKMIGTIEFAHK